MYQAFVDPIASAITGGGGGQGIGAQQDAQRQQLAMAKRNQDQQAFDKSYSEVSKGNERLQKDLEVTHPELSSYYQQQWGDSIDDISGEIAKNPRADSVSQYHLNKYNKMIHDKEMRTFLQKSKLEQANMEEEEKALEKAPDYIKEKYAGRLGKNRQVLKRDGNGALTSEFILSPEERERMMREVRGQSMTIEKYQNNLKRDYKVTTSANTKKYLDISRQLYLGDQEMNDLREQVKYNGPLKEESKIWEGGPDSLSSLINNKDFLAQQVAQGNFKDENEAKAYFEKGYSEYKDRVDKAVEGKINLVHQLYMTYADDTDKSQKTTINNNTKVVNEAENKPAALSALEQWRGYKDGQVVDRKARKDLVSQNGEVKVISLPTEHGGTFTVNTTPVTDTSKLDFHLTSNKQSGHWMNEFKKRLINTGSTIDWNIDASATKQGGKMKNGQIILSKAQYDAVIPQLFAEYKKQNSSHLGLFANESGYYSDADDFAEKVLGITPGIGGKVGKTKRTESPYYTIRCAYNILLNPTGEVNSITHDKTLTTNRKHDELEKRKEYYQNHRQ